MWDRSLSSCLARAMTDRHPPILGRRGIKALPGYRTILPARIHLDLHRSIVALPNALGRSMCVLNLSPGEARSMGPVGMAQALAVYRPASPVLQHADVFSHAAGRRLRRRRSTFLLVSRAFRPWPAGEAETDLPADAVLRPVPMRGTRRGGMSAGDRRACCASSAHRPVVRR